jgi:hypothetical protein
MQSNGRSCKHVHAPTSTNLPAGVLQVATFGFGICSDARAMSHTAVLKTSLRNSGQLLPITLPDAALLAGPQRHVILCCVNHRGVAHQAQLFKGLLQYCYKQWTSVYSEANPVRRGLGEVPRRHVMTTPSTICIAKRMPCKSQTLPYHSVSWHIKTVEVQHCPDVSQRMLTSSHMLGLRHSVSHA